MAELSDQICQTIDAWRAKFPNSQARSAVLMALRTVQDADGYLSDEALENVAAYLNIPLAQVSEVVSFYSMYRRAPEGQHTLAVCTSLSCHLCQAHGLLAHLKTRLGVGPGETTQDGRFTVKVAECLAACGGAPAVLVDDQHYHECVTPEALDTLIDELSESKDTADG